ncbi:hypothetical protein [Bacillus piscicola]|uniref:ParM/StbA family protein n=1 Tax=Bacillus piscicola TaxID=1632684 RepID=UPI001F08A943|nr:hypothetical protein [Bacillus piscicola]
MLHIIQKLYDENVLISGVDQGNKSAKFSYLNRDGNIESFAIPTIVAPAEDKKSAVEGSTETNSIDKKLHLKITSKSLSTVNQERYVYVGHFARNKNGKMEPAYDSLQDSPKSVSHSKFSSDLHLVTTLAGLAVMAARESKEEVYIPYAGGLPVSEMKELGSEKALESVKGTHTIEFMDGPLEKKVVTLIIDSGKMYGEGAITDLSLNFDVQAGDLVETTLQDRLSNTYALGDLGAGTSEMIIFTEEGIDGNLSQSLQVEGTNPYIDRIREKVDNMEEFQTLKELFDLDESERAYQSREEFMSEVIEPAILEVIRGETASPVFEVRFLKAKKKTDVTEIVMEEIRKYANDHKKVLTSAWNSAGVDDLVLVGGGLLFGYPVFKEVQEKFQELQGQEWVVMPDKVEESPYFTSKGYLIANFIHITEKEEEGLESVES